MALRQVFPKSVRLDAAGAGFVEITMRGDFLVQIQTTRVVTSAGADPVPQATANVTINGDDFDSSAGANRDVSDTQHLMLAGDIIRCEWSGGAPLGTATYTVRGIQYNAGEGMAAIARAG